MVFFLCQRIQSTDSDLINTDWGTDLQTWSSNKLEHTMVLYYSFFSESDILETLSHMERMYM